MRRLIIAVVFLLLAVTGSFWIAHVIQGQERILDTKAAKEMTLQKGTWIVVSDGPVVLSGKIISAQPVKLPGASFVHFDRSKDGKRQRCDGEVRQRITNDGKIVLHCMECGQEWEVKTNATPKH